MQRGYTAYLTSIAAAAMMIATPVSATTIAWNGSSDFDQWSQSFAPISASKISFSGNNNNYGIGYAGPFAHSHDEGQGLIWSILLTVNGVDKMIFSQSLQNEDVTSLAALGTLSFAGGSVSKLTFDCVNCSYNTYHQFGADTSFTLSGAVPEPASWALLVAGFGLSGAAMRRRRVAAAIA